MDNQQSAEPTGALDQAGAVEAFKAFLNPEPPETEKEEAKPEPEAKEEAKSEEAEAEPEQEAEEEDDLITVNIDGKEVTLSKKQIAEDHKSGLRQADYTRKTMEVAEQRKAAESERQAALQERANYASNLQKMAAQLEGALEEQSKIDWDSLLQQDPVEYLKQQALVQKRQAALQQNFAEQQKVQAQFQAEQQKAYAQHVQDQQEQLLAKIPEWRDAKKASEDKTALRNYLLEQGYDKTAVESVADAKAVMLARKAMLYDQMVAKASAAAKKVSTLPTKVERPGNGKSVDQRTSAFQRLSKTGRVSDAAEVFKSLL